MSYEVIARKWRPSRFEDVVGQEHVTQTLKNAIELGRISQSYLFSGPRGVGKTTLARILVRCLNCEKGGPTVTPCGKCAQCRGVSDGSSLDYREIDGASNRGIDQIREINDTLKYVSSSDRYRVIVIDEVHMLTKEAFNALLKNLEEPPEKVVFIFCTTEPQKVPQTIRSRCQHYALRSFSIQEIVNQLEKIAHSDGVSFEKEAFYLIAKGAQGSMRDSQSILDQCIAYSGENITTQSVTELLGISENQTYFDFLEALAQNDLKRNQSFVYHLREEGKRIQPFLYTLLEKINALVFIKNGVDRPEDLDLLKEELESLSLLVPRFTLDDLFTLSDLCFDWLENLKQTLHEEIVVDYFLIKLHRYNSLITPSSLKQQLLAISQSDPNGILEGADPTPTESAILEQKALEKNEESPASPTKPLAIDLFLKRMCQRTKSHLVGFTQPFLTLAGDLDEETKRKIREKIKLDYHFDLRLNVIEPEKKGLVHLHEAFVETGGEVLKP